MRKRTVPIRRSADGQSQPDRPALRLVSAAAGGAAPATIFILPATPQAQPAISRDAASSRHSPTLPGPSPEGSAPATAGIPGRPPSLFHAAPSRLADLEALYALERQSFPAHDAFSRSQFRYLLSNPRASFHLVRRDGRIVGSAILLRRRTRTGLAGRLYSLAVSPDCRGQGLGRVLMDDVLAACRREGIGRLALEVRADNAPAIALYRKYGFCTAHRLPDYYGARQDGLKMVAEL